MNTENKDTKKESVLKLIISDGKMAKFQRATAGVLYYRVDVGIDCAYEFTVDMNDKDDVGTATFYAEIKAITLMRYIRKAENAGTLVNIGMLHSEPGAPGIAGHTD